MSTGMSTKLKVGGSVGQESHGHVLGTIALLAGIALLALGIRMDQPLFLIPGFTAFSSALLYFNSLFWSWVYEGKAENKPPLRG